MEFGEEPLDFQIPDVAEPIVGYRSWLVEHQGIFNRNGFVKMPCGPARLMSSFGHDFWEPGEAMVARCGNSQIAVQDRITKGRECDESPSRSKQGHHGFGCGIYAYKDPTRAAAYHNPASFKNAVWGEILMWGNVYEHEHGFRAQYAWPSAFASMKGVAFTMMAEALVECYEVGTILDMREIPEAGRWNPLTRTLEGTLTETDFLLDSSVTWRGLP